MKYTINQQKAIDYWEGNLQIIACAGSGKTDVITRRIAKLISTGVDTASIVAFTFTDNAAEEMKFRIRKHLQELRPDNPELGDMYVGTVHSFCYELLKEYKPKYKAYDVLDENQKIIFVSTYNHSRRIGLEQLFPQRRFRNFEQFCLNVDIVREEIIDSSLLPEPFQSCFTNYLQLLDDERFLDFSGMMSEVVRLFSEDSEFASQISTRFQHIIVDEYQDINPIQEKIIQLLVGDNSNICVVGDDDQCIYQWRGTNVNNLLTFADRYHNVTSIDITTNFRSSNVIIDTAREFIEQNPNRLNKRISSWDDAKIQFDIGDLYTVFFPTAQEEIDFVIDKINELRGTKYINNKGEEYSLDYRDIAIFFRSVKFSAEPYIRAFKEHDIPFVVKGGGKLFEQEEVVLAVKSLAYLANYAYGKGKITLATLRELYQTCFGSEGDIKEYLRKIELYKSNTSLDEYISLQGLFQRVLNFFGTEEFELSEIQYYNLGMLSQTITDFEAVYKSIKLKDLKYFLGFIVGYAERSYEEGGSDDPTKINAVKIMTVHRAKGLQFPIVFIPELIGGLFPSRARPGNWLIPEHLFNTARYEGSIEDERRLFYVAVTRSEKFLFLSGSARGLRGRRTQEPSRFFEEFSKEYSLSLPVEDPVLRERLDLSVSAPLKRFATSYSDLRYFDRCPYDYKLRFIYGFNPEIALALGYGKSVHNILNIIHSDYRANPPSSEVVERIVDENFFLRYCTREFMDRFKNSATRIVQNYVKNFGYEFNLILETEKSFEFALEETLIAGQIDLIKKLNEKGELEALEIVDFKEHDNTELATDYVKQLRLYAIASIRALGFHPKQATVHHLDEGTRSEVDISQDILDDVEDEISETVIKIMNRKFSKYPSKKKCSACDWRFFCTKTD